MLNSKKVGHFLLLICFSVLYPSAGQSSEFIEKHVSVKLAELSVEKTLKLSKNPNWRRLLKYRPKDKKSQIITDDFFLSEKGFKDPHQELIATLNAISKPFPEEPNKHALCVFPARTYWLEQQLNVSFEKQRRAHCTKLIQWMKPANLSSISLLMVSGYFGNPASTYGHVVIKLNNGEEIDSNLQDQSINFGALIPENENTLVYILKGLFGGYNAGFSDRKFYTQDLIYTQIESRDLWEYELNLEQPKLNLLVYHLWELVGKKFTYYFLKNNCAYHVTSLLEIAYDQDLIIDQKAWYLPVETFYALRDISAAKGTLTYDSLTYVPSRKNTLYQRFERFPKTLQKQINNQVQLLINDVERQIQIEQFSDNPLILEFLLEYIDYKFLELDGTYKKNVEKIRSKLLLARLALPKNEQQEITEISFLQPPSAAPKPHLIAPFIKFSSGSSSEVGLRFSPAYFDAIGGNKGQLEFSDLTTLETIVASNDESGFYLEKLDLLRIRQLSINTTSLTGENNRSWQFRTGIVRSDDECFSCYTYLLEGGVGKAFELKKGLIGYGLLTSYYSTAGSKIDVGANVGVLYQPKLEKLKLGLEFQLSPSPPIDDESYLLKGELRYSLTKSSQLRATYENDEHSNLMLSLFHYF